MIPCALFTQALTGNYKPSWVKFRYGAWYLDPKSWKRMDADEMLEDPKTQKDKDSSEHKQKSDALVSDLEKSCKIS